MGIKNFKRFLVSYYPFSDWYNRYHEGKIKYHVVSYPKSGRTWLNFMLVQIFFKINGLRNDEFFNLERAYKYGRKFPSIRFSHDDNPHLVHINKININKSYFKDKKVIFLIRDPRDVLVSYFFEFTKRGVKENMNIKREISKEEFITFEYGGLPSIIKYYNSWADNISVPKEFLLVKYEDLKNDPLSELEKITDFLGINVIHHPILKQAVFSSSFEEMRK